MTGENVTVGYLKNTIVLPDDIGKFMSNVWLMSCPKKCRFDKAKATGIELNLLRTHVEVFVRLNVVVITPDVDFMKTRRLDIELVKVTELNLVKIHVACEAA